MWPDVVGDARLFATAFYRRPTNVALLLVLPPIVVYSYAMALAPTIGPEAGLVNGALFTTAFLTGLFGLFQVTESANTDGRLVWSGYARTSLFAVRFVTVAAVSVLVSTVSFLVVSAMTSPERPAIAFAVLVFSGGLYGLVGVLVGSVLPRRLESSLLLIFLADMDTFFSAGADEVQTVIPRLFPLHYPRRLLDAAIVDGTVAISDVGFASGYLFVLGALVAAFFRRTMEAEVTARE